MKPFTMTSLDAPDKLNTGLAALPEYATRSSLQVQQGAMVLETLRRDPPGMLGSDRYLQSQKFTGPVFLAVKAFMRAMGSVAPQVQKKVRHTNKTTFLPKATIRKAMNSNSFGRDHEFVPAEQDWPVCQLLEHPNERGDTFKDVFQYNIMQDKLTGVAPLWCVPNRRHQPVEIYALPAVLVQPNLTPSPQYPNGAYTLNPYYANGAAGYLPGGYGGAGATIPAEEMHRRLQPHPFLIWDGYSPLSAGGMELDILSAIDQCWWSVLDHGVILDTLLLMPGNDGSQITRLETQIKQRHGGARNSRRMFVLGGGEAEAKYDVKQLSPNVRDMDFPEGRATMLDFCMALFGVPKALLLDSDSVTYATLYATIKKFHLLTLQPDANDWADLYSRWLCDPWSKKPGEYRIKLTVPSVDDESIDQDQQKIDINIVSVNDRLAKQDRPPVEFGEYPEPVYLEMLRTKVMPQPVMPALPTTGPDKRDDNAALTKDAAVEASRPTNEAASGSLPGRMAKAMSSIDQTAGGVLVNPRKTVRGRGANRLLARLACKALEGK